jgi:hypothetical protein
MPKGKQGFASMPKEYRSAIASHAGKMAHLKKKAHTWTSKEASVAGRKGGRKSSRKKR